MTEIFVDIPAGSTLLCGWNGHALQVLNELRTAGRSVTVVARRRPAELTDSSVPFVQGNVSDDATLIKAGVMNASAAVILAEDAGVLPNDTVDARSILTALAIETLHPEIYSVLEILNTENERHAFNANVDNVVYCDRLIANYVALCASQRGISAFANDLFSQSGSVSLNAVEVESKWAGHTVGELFAKMRENRELPLGVMHQTDDENREVWQHEINPPASEKIVLPLKVIFIHTK